MIEKDLISHLAGSLSVSSNNLSSVIDV